MKSFKLPYGIKVVVENNGVGTITSDITTHFGATKKAKTIANVMESMILGHACAGINVGSPEYIDGVKTSMKAIVNKITF